MPCAASVADPEFAHAAVACAGIRDGLRIEDPGGVALVAGEEGSVGELYGTVDGSVGKADHKRPEGGGTGYSPTLKSRR